MLLFNLFQDPALFVVYILALASAMSVHESAHALAADRLGDSTAKDMGRLTLNPIAHLDPVGTVMLLLVGFGWGKPVPVNENRLKSRTSVILVALAGPASNLIAAIVLGLIFRFTTYQPLQVALEFFIFFNLALMLFNLIPIPPLDGSKVLKLFIPDTTYYWMQQYGFYILIILFFVLSFGNTGLSGWLITAVSYLFHLITGTTLSF